MKKLTILAIITMLSAFCVPRALGQLNTSNDDPRRAKCQREAIAWSSKDEGVNETGRSQTAVPYMELVDHSAEMCECAALYPHTDNTATEFMQNPTNFYLPYGLLCTRYEGEVGRRLSDFIVRHPNVGKQFLAEDAQGKR